ncbi:hypothetical protein [Bradyrhizobium sp. CCBAU 11434]|uniref:hypothetical protein n=1 Tax=Bradyrhizobium sp. CCBAU 11434 TaxID=1630885 RepID=UPI00230691A0|nr:hypothetical protein [Bradyrhizobium sp. CCBAU 11434]
MTATICHQRHERGIVFVLSHFVVDLHQPLHVGAAYLDSASHLVDPDVTHTVDPATETAGSNLITDDRKDFHGEWDDVPEILVRQRPP